MSKVRAYSPVLQFFNDDGSPMVGGHLDTYKAGTSIPVATYANESGTLNPVSIPLDSRGECTVFIVSGMKYKFVLKDKDGVVKWTADNYGVNESGEGGGSGEDVYEIAMFDLSQAGHSLYDDIDANLGAGLLPIIYTGSQGRVRYYYYTARDSQAHTMTFTCGYDGSVELLVLKSDDTYTFKKVNPPYILTHGTLDKTQSEYGMPLMAMAGSGGDIWLDNANQIRVKPGIYHVDYEAQVFVATEDGDQLQDGIRKVTAILQTATKTHRNSINVDMTYSHTELLQGSYDFKALSESQLMFHLENIGDYVRYSLYGLDVFKISE